jgi:hypothetical protein
MTSTDTTVTAPASTTTAPATPTVGATLSADALAALSAIQQDTVKAFWPVLVGMLTNINKNGSVSNVIAQGTAVWPELVAAFPNWEQSVSQDLAGQILTDVQTQVLPLITPASTSTSTS